VKPQEDVTMSAQSTMKWNNRTWAAAVAVVLAIETAMAVDVTVDFDKAFDFKSARTWAWKADEPGAVRMARTQDDDPEAARARAEPIIMAAVAAELERRGLQRATGTPDLTVGYFLLLSTNLSAQTVGHYLPSVTEWALPPFNRGTQSLTLLNRGSLVLDVTAKQAIVWRGVANANIKVDADDRAREALIREAVRDLLRRFPASRG
jgi:hypothetical protein